MTENKATIGKLEVLAIATGELGKTIGDYIKAKIEEQDLYVLFIGEYDEKEFCGSDSANSLKIARMQLIVWVDWDEEDFFSALKYVSEKEGLIKLIKLSIEQRKQFEFIGDERINSLTCTWEEALKYFDSL